MSKGVQQRYDLQGCVQRRTARGTTYEKCLRIFFVQFLGSNLIAVYNFLIRQDIEGVVDNAKFVGLNPLWAIYLRVQLSGPCETLPTQNILWVCVCLFSLVSYHRIYGNAIQLPQGKFRLNIRKRFFAERVIKHWNKFPGEVIMISPCSTRVKTIFLYK